MNKYKQKQQTFATYKINFYNTLNSTRKNPKFSMEQKFIVCYFASIFSVGIFRDVFRTLSNI